MLTITRLRKAIQTIQNPRVLFVNPTDFSEIKTLLYIYDDRDNIRFDRTIILLREWDDSGECKDTYGESLESWMESQ